MTTIGVLLPTQYHGKAHGDLNAWVITGEYSNPTAFFDALPAEAAELGFARDRQHRNVYRSPHGFAYVGWWTRRDDLTRELEVYQRWQGDAGDRIREQLAAV